MRSWGQISRGPKAVFELQSNDLRLPTTDYSLLAFGLGRSYGDVCFNDNGSLLLTEKLNSIIAFDREKGILRAECGITLGKILSHVVPQGWIIPVIPGTQHVTLGGAIANDVHGKNHFKEGSFGSHIRSFGLLRTSGENLICSEKENVPYFQATIGGLGLTGFVSWAEIQLKKIPSSCLDVECLEVHSFEEFEVLSKASQSTHEFSVAWIDLASRNKNFHRGLFYRANFSETHSGLSFSPKEKWDFPLRIPQRLLGPGYLAAYNSIYFNFQTLFPKAKAASIEEFFYPLDLLNDWNEIYGESGFLQLQCQLSWNSASYAISAMNKTMHNFNIRPFLSVMKNFGGKRSPGILSFPREGLTLAMDFPHRGRETISFLNELNAIAVDCGGSIYPAKDSTMTDQQFKSSFPGWAKWVECKDPQFSSNFWRRVMKD